MFQSGSLYRVENSVTKTDATIPAGISRNVARGFGIAFCFSARSSFPGGCVRVSIIVFLIASARFCLPGQPIDKSLCCDRLVAITVILNVTINAPGNPWGGEKEKEK